jgi:acyl-[acyl-carrier-protein]-phospholipid O-acyltransferase/long-chain-fatty-acid--[acyl-carrier-protein] ligase
MIPHEKLKAELERGEAEFNAKESLGEHLAAACIKGLMRDPAREVIVDCTGERKVLKAGTVLALGILLARKWKREIPERRVGVALPPGIGGLLANLGLVLAGKTPVNLNFTLGPEAAGSCLRQGEISKVITAAAVKKKLTKFPWPETTIDIRDELASLGKLKIVGQMLRLRLSSAGGLIRSLGIPARGGDEEAALLFTSGSSGDPKGVVLSHRNIIGNSLQILDKEVLSPGDSIMACLPIFHSFGFTVAMWYPVIHGVKIVSYPSPLEVKKIAAVIERESVNVLVGSATFLRPYLKRATREQLASLKWAIAGAEKLPPELHDAFLDVLGVKIIEGYGLTETSPVVSVNGPAASTKDPQEARKDTEQSKAGSIGRPLKGINVKVVDPASGDELSLTDTGMLCFRGANVFPGYLDLPDQTAEAIRDGWFHSGDLGRMDEDGFLFIEGRLSRFSKLGGEMVPHGAVEQRVIEAYGWQAEDEQVAVVVGVPDAAKGEALVVLTTRPIDPAEMASRLSEMGLANLWIPKRVVEIGEIPMLATGKLDLRGCREAAIEGVESG